MATKSNVKKRVIKDNTQELERRIEYLNKFVLRIGVFGEDDSFMLMIAKVNEFGTDIKPKASKYLTVPCNPKAYGKKASEFDDLYVLKDSKGQLWLVRNKGTDELEFMFMLAKEIKIPERSFIRGSYDDNKRKISNYIKTKIGQLITLQISIDQFENSVGEYLVSLTKRYMTDLRKPEKSPITLAANPKKQNPLINSGRLRNSIVWKFERRR